jgi:isopenicillin N synthase-like dioxygenase
LSLANDPFGRGALLQQLREALFNIGFLYIKNHGVQEETISNLARLLPPLFAQPPKAKAALSKLNSPHFLGYSGYAEESTLGVKDLREQFDFATELSAIWEHPGAAPTGSTSGKPEANFTELYWRLRGPNQWPSEAHVPGFKKAFIDYHDSIEALSYRFVHLVEEAFGIPIGTCDAFFSGKPELVNGRSHRLPPQHRIKLVKYPSSSGSKPGQGVGAHKDSSGWLTFLYQVGKEEGLQVLGSNGEWINARPIEGTFVVNFGNAFEAATEGAVKATIHRVQAPTLGSNPRYSIPFFMGLPLDLTVSQLRSYIPASVRKLRRETKTTSPKDDVSSFLDPRWDSLGHSQLRKWIRSHQDVGRLWYGDDVTEFYLT